jgi:uncharacterized protein YndB with AHSA1/START domain
MRRWWSPRHFVVAGCDVDPVPGGPLCIVMEEGDGGRHVVTGRFLDLHPAPPSASSWHWDGVALFSAVHDVSLARSGTGTKLSLTIRVTVAAAGSRCRARGHAPLLEPAP